MPHDQLRERHEVVSALARVSADRARLFSLLARDLPLEEMTTAIRAEFDLSEMQARAVTDMQVRHFAADQRAKTETYLAEPEEQSAARRHRPDDAP